MKYAFSQATLCKIYRYSQIALSYSSPRAWLLIDQGFPTFLFLCTPSAFRLISTNPFSFSTDRHVYF